MVMYFLIALLEDCGYMARVSVVLDPIFKRVGLSGKSVIPFVITIGCAVPGIMATRTIRNERERRATAMLAPFMPCGAKIPVIALFAGAFFDNAGWVSALAYLTGIALIFLGALLVNKIAGHKARKSFFLIELPAYKAPSLLRAFTSMLGRGWAYIKKATTIILLCNTAVQIMQTFTFSFQVAETSDASILAAIAGPFAYLLVPVEKLDANGKTVDWHTRTTLLLHSRDKLKSFDVYQLPGRVATFEKLDGHNTDCLKRPPLILLGDYAYFRDGDPAGYLLTPSRKADGSLDLGKPIKYAEFAISPDQHSGGGNLAITRGDKVFLVFGVASVNAIAMQKQNLHRTQQKRYADFHHRI